MRPWLLFMSGTPSRNCDLPANLNYGFNFAALPWGPVAGTARVGLPAGPGPGRPGRVRQRVAVIELNLSEGQAGPGSGGGA